MEDLDGAIIECWAFFCMHHRFEINEWSSKAVVMFNLCMSQLMRLWECGQFGPWLIRP